MERIPVRVIYKGNSQIHLLTGGANKGIGGGASEGSYHGGGGSRKRFLCFWLPCRKVQTFIEKEKNLQKEKKLGGSEGDLLLGEKGKEARLKKTRFELLGGHPAYSTGSGLLGKRGDEGVKKREFPAITSIPIQEGGRPKKSERLKIWK